MKPAALTPVAIALATQALPMPTHLVVARGPEMRVFYDYGEDGHLAGGTLIVDPNDPQHHTDFGLARAAVTGDWVVTTIANGGGPENRIDLVFLGDGYTESDLGTYAGHVDRVLQGFLSEEPLGAYASYFNVHRVDIVSDESGVDEPNLSIFRDTALDMTFGCGGIAGLLCVDTGKAAAAAALAPDVDQVLAVANSTRYGGAAYTWMNLATVPGDNPSTTEIALHEVGHTLGGLADEYFCFDGSTYTGPEVALPNISIYDIDRQIQQSTKWHAWMDPPNVSTFEGATHHQFGIFRPTENSKMRGLGVPFGPVNGEQLVINIYESLSPIDQATPPSARALPAGTGFWVTPLEPTDHALRVQWSVDGVAVPGGTETAFTADFAALELGVHEVSVIVVDDTPRVRDEGAREAWMTAIRQWQINVLAGDYEGDDDVDLADVGWLQTCFSGWGEWIDPRCNASDIDDDHDVDLVDFMRLEADLTGPKRGPGAD